MEATTKAAYQQAIKIYQAFLEGKRVNVIDPDGSKPSKKRIRVRIKQLEQALKGGLR